MKNNKEYKEIIKELKKDTTISTVRLYKHPMKNRTIVKSGSQIRNTRR